MGQCLTMLFVMVQREVSRNYAIDRKVKALMEGQNLEGNAALEGQSAAPPIRKSSRISSPAADLEELGNLRPKAPPVCFQDAAVCKNPCSYWATVCRPDFEWIGSCCEFQCTKVKGHPEPYCSCEFHRPCDDGARPRSTSVSPSPGALPSNVTEH